MKVAIVGYGLEGRSALRYWQQQGADILVCDRNEKIEVPPGVKSQLGPDHMKNLDGYDVIMRTAGLHPKHILAENPGVEDKITTTVDEFIRVSPTRNLIGVTGTKGKGTTCMLIKTMLEAAGKQTFIGGNYGISPFDFLDQLTPDSWVVLEFSSYMLYDIHRSTHIAVCLVMHPEHLDWHGDVQDYYRAKQNLFAHQSENDVAIYYADNLVSHKIASASPGDKIAYFDEPGAYVTEGGDIMIDQTVLCKTSELKLLGKHNWQNVCAAVTAVWQVAQVPDAIRGVLTTFAGLPHRLEMVREVEGVQYYNDSFASDPYAAEAAIEAIPGKKLLITGGWDERQLPLDNYAEVIAKNKDVQGVLLIGASAERLGAALKKAGYTSFFISPARTMPEIVMEAQSHAKKGYSVVLSPGFPSFDMFKNFEERGLQFKEAVHNL
ncbi:MAG TPA: UDP-N-acetylmuramoyl-L-alanine--D-glutamate ligase [Bacillota bacterium]|nr:UDP-N-acetylmuramoyl-L-alanine--D-glutamate ligase [Bacillota bacterium]